MNSCTSARVSRYTETRLNFVLLFLSGKQQAWYKKGGAGVWGCFCWNSCFKKEQSRGTQTDYFVSNNIVQELLYYAC